MRRLANLLRKPMPLAQAKEYRAQAERQALFSVPIPPSSFAILFKESCFINSSFMVKRKSILGRSWRKDKNNH
jgi:hypothetical protein